MRESLWRVHGAFRIWENLKASQGSFRGFGNGFIIILVFLASPRRGVGWAIRHRDGWRHRQQPVECEYPTTTSRGGAADYGD